MTDEGGLHLLVSPSKRNPEAGTKLWQVRYHLHGKRSLYSAGSYPLVTLARAREIALEVRATTRQGKNPVQAKKANLLKAKTENETTFRKVAARWIANKRAGWKPKTSTAIEGRLRNHVFPVFGDLPVSDITTSMLIGWIEKLDATMPGTAKLALADVGGVFRRARIEGAIHADPSEPLSDVVQARRITPRPAVAKIERARELLAIIEATRTNPMILLASRFLVLTSVRSMECLGARMSEMSGLDGPNPLWTIPAERMKGHKDKGRAHTVALSRQAVEVIRAARLVSTGDAIFTISKRHATSVGQSTLQELYERAGIKKPFVQPEIVPHGWRSTFSTIMNEAHPNDRQIIDLMLAHSRGGEVSAIEGVYNRAEHIERRRALHQAWAEMVLQGAPTALGLVVPGAGPSVVAMAQAAA
jgi:integrase